MQSMSVYDRRIMQISFLGFIICVIYWRGVFNNFAYDDWYYIVGNEVYRNFDLKKVFTSLANGIEYLPVRDLSMIADFLAWGEKNPGGFHLSNIIWFFFTTISLYFVVQEIIALLISDSQKLAGVKYVPLLTAALFVAHPVNGEAVNFIGGRNVILASCFFFLSIFFYIRLLRSERFSAWNYAFSIALFIVAMFSKATVIVLPFLLLALQLLAYGRSGLRRLMWLDPFFVLSALFFYFFTRVGVSAQLIEKSPLSNVLSTAWIAGKLTKAVQIPFFYLRKLFVPTGLTIRYDNHFADQFFTPVVIAAFIGVLILTVIPFLLARKYPLLSCGIIWFLVTLLPVLNLYDTYPVVADRYLFIPGIGVFLVIAALLSMLLETGYKSAAVTLVLVMLLCCGGYSHARVGVWKDNKSLWQATIDTNPQAVEAYTALGSEYLRAGDYDHAIKLFKEAGRISPKSVSYELGMGSVYFVQGDSRSAIEILNRALLVNPDSARVHNLLGDVYASIGELEKALEHYAAVLKTGQEGHHLVSGIKVKMAKLSASPPQSLAALRQKAAASPNDLKLLGDLALQLDQRSEYDEAMACYQKLERLGMNDWRLFNNMANIFMKKRLFSKSSVYYERSLALNPKNPDALNNLGLVRSNLGDFKGAIAAFEKAMAVDSNYSYAPFNLARTYRRMGVRQEAERYFHYTVNRFPQLREKVQHEMQS